MNKTVGQAETVYVYKYFLKNRQTDCNYKSK